MRRGRPAQRQSPFRTRKCSAKTRLPARDYPSSTRNMKRVCMWEYCGSHCSLRVEMTTDGFNLAGRVLVHG